MPVHSSLEFFKPVSKDVPPLPSWVERHLYDEHGETPKTVFEGAWWVISTTNPNYNVYVILAEDGFSVLIDFGPERTIYCPFFNRDRFTLEEGPGGNSVIVRRWNKCTIFHPACKYDSGESFDVDSFNSGDDKFEGVEHNGRFNFNILGAFKVDSLLNLAP